MTTKAREGAQHTAENEDPNVACPPAYHLHEYDEVYTANHVTGSHPSSPTSPTSTGIPLYPTISTSNPAHGPLSESLSLTMDDDLIYPTLPPSNALYHIPRRLTWSGDCVYLERSVPERQKKDGTTVPTADQELYEIALRPYARSIELSGKRASCFGRGKGNMTRPSIFHDTWEVSFQKELAVRYKKSKWTDKENKLLATEVELGKADGKLGYKQRRTMVVEAGVDPKLLNLLVACWTAKVWRELQATVTKETSVDRMKEALKTGSKLSTCDQMADRVALAEHVISRNN